MATTFSPRKQDRFQVSFIDEYSFWLIDTQEKHQRKKCYCHPLSTFRDDYYECVRLVLLKSEM